MDSTILSLFHYQLYIISIPAQNIEIQILLITYITKELLSLIPRTKYKTFDVQAKHSKQFSCQSSSFCQPGTTFSQKAVETEVIVDGCVYPLSCRILSPLHSCLASFPNTRSALLSRLVRPHKSESFDHVDEQSGTVSPQRTFFAACEEGTSASFVLVPWVSLNMHFELAIASFRWSCQFEKNAKTGQDRWEYTIRMENKEYQS